MLKSIALIGNPNCGKTTLFNRLTGAQQKVGNWPGVTVEQFHGKLVDPATRSSIAIVDLPGCYSLVATIDMPLDEKITCEFLRDARNTIFLNVVDAAHLSRDLYLTMQLLAMDVPVIVALNCMDELPAAGLGVNVAELSARLGCPVLPIVAKTGQGFKELTRVLVQGEVQINVCTACKVDLASDLTAAISNWQPYCTTPEVLRILEGDVLLAEKLTAAGIDVGQARKQLQREVGMELDLYFALQRRQAIDKILDTCVGCAAEVPKTISARIDAWVLHKVAGPLIFLSVMYLMFTCAINLGGVLQEYVEQASEALLLTDLRLWLTDLHWAPWLVSVFSDGIGKGISITLTFAPVLGAMFLCLGILESSGYMARAAFLVDRLMGAIGLSGKSLVPMIVGFGCNVPAIMGTRTISNQRERLLTILMTPFMSCSARLAIYAIFVATFFPVGGQNVIFSLYLIGIAVAVLTAYALRGGDSTNEQTISVSEMPNYRWPLWGGLFRQVWQRLKGFLIKAGVLIVVLTVLINGMGNDVLASIGKTLTPLFAPMGIGAENWPATVGLFTGLLAKEAVMGTLNAFYSGPEHMVSAFGGAVPAYAYLLFTLLYFPCVSVVAVIARELSWRWAMFSVLWSTGLAYLIAALFYQVATLRSWAWIAGLSLVLAAVFAGARVLGRRAVGRDARRKVIATRVVYEG